MEHLKNNNLLNYFSQEELTIIYEEQDLYQKALIIVTTLFKDKVDKSGKPYIGHLIRVSNQLEDLDEKVAGLLHDTLEDTDITYKDLITIGFPKEILDIVKIVTKDDMDTSKMSQEEKLNIYYKKIDSIIHSGNIHAIRLKLADMSDNYDLNRLKDLPKEKQEWFHKKYGTQLKKLEAYMNIDKKLKEYIETNILTEYAKNDLGHNIDHIYYVIERSLKFASTIPNINYNMVYTIAAYHDIGHHIDAKNHEKVSSEILLKDEKLRQFFKEEEILIMAEAVYDHRASLEYEPRSIYGKIVSSADRNTKIDSPLKRTYEYRVRHNEDYFLSKIIIESLQHIIEKFGSSGYASEKIYFEDLEYKEFLDNISRLTEDIDLFIEKYLLVNNIDEQIYKTIFERIKHDNPTLSLDELLYETYLRTRVKETEGFDKYRQAILNANDIDELEYYTKDVDPKLKEYVEKYIFPQYKKNDGAHGIVHIIEVIRRSFALNDTFKLGLSPNMIYATAAYHDLGKHEDHENHHLIGAKRFIADDNLKKFFNDEERKIIKEAIEDHRSSKEDEPRSEYGKLVSSADRNTSIDIVFIRSFFVAKERQPETNIEDYLDYTIKRLSKKYDEENPENMFYEDQTYQEFIKDMRLLLKKEEEFKTRYCDVNNITSRNHTVGEEQGKISYTRRLKK